MGCGDTGILDPAVGGVGGTIAIGVLTIGCTRDAACCWKLVIGRRLRAGVLGCGIAAAGSLVALPK